jgi:hypothetical protein
MITPACAVQLGSSTPIVAHDNINPTNGKVPEVMQIDNYLPELNPKTSTVTSSKQQFESKNQYSDIIEHAYELLPVMEESYQNSSDDLIKSNKTLEDLKKQRTDALSKANELKNNIDNYELSINNTSNYKELKKKYQNQLNLVTEIEATEKSICDVNDVLKDKNFHTKNCVVALKEITQSKNLPEAVKSYNSNIELLATISNNMTEQVKNSKDNIVVMSNSTYNDINSTISTINGETDTDDKLLITGLVIGGIGITILGISIVPAAIFAVKLVGHSLIAPVLDSLAICAVTIGVIGLFVALVGFACLIAYAGNKWHWWKL